MRQALQEASFGRLVAAVAVVMLALFAAGVLVSLAILTVENARHEGGHNGSTFIVTTTPAPRP